MEINILRLWLTLDSVLDKTEAEKIRGCLGHLFWDNPYAHHHKADGSLIYRYPCVQYKIVNGAFVLIGFDGGLDIVKNTFHDLKEINFNGTWKEVLSKGLENYIAIFGISPKKNTYSFITPWLALNEENYEKYKKIEEKAQKKELLNKILTGNIISMSKSLGYTVEKPIEAKILRIKEVSVKLKGVKMIGFLGSFSVNFEIPDYFGLGKSVSRGFGTIIKIGSNCSNSSSCSKSSKGG